MPPTDIRYLVVAGLLLGTATLAGVVQGPAPSAARWSTDETLFTADGWQVSEASVTEDHGEHFVSRSYRGLDGSQFLLSIATDTNAKNVYRAGADVPFLGQGYLVQPAPPELTPMAAGQSAFIAARGADQWLVVYAFGERRGFLGNGPLAWSAAIFDGVVGRPNDYYLLRAMVPFQPANKTDPRAAVALAEILFTRLSAWYRA